DTASNELGISWAPDGTRFAFVSERDGNYELYVQDLLGNRTRLTNTPTDLEADPAWSPDGQAIAFGRLNSLSFEGIFLIDPDGSNERFLANSAEGANPSWSPDGTQLVMDKRLIPSRFDDPDRSDLWIIDADGSGSHALITLGDSQVEAAWSPDGETIAYRDVFGPPEASFNGQIRLINADGTGDRFLRGFGGQEMQPAWSPDGQQIAFT